MLTLFIHKKELSKHVRNNLIEYSGYSNYNWFHESGSFSVHSFNGNLIICILNITCNQRKVKLKFSLHVIYVHTAHHARRAVITLEDEC